MGFFGLLVVLISAFAFSEEMSPLMRSLQVRFGCYCLFGNFRAGPHLNVSVREIVFEHASQPNAETSYFPWQIARHRLVHVCCGARSCSCGGYLQSES